MCGGDFVEVYSDPSQVGRRIYFLLMFHATNNSWNFRSTKETFIHAILIYFAEN